MGRGRWRHGDRERAAGLSTLSTLTLVDLAVLLLVVLAAVVALRRGRGLLAAVGSGAGALVACWLVLVAVAAWGPRPADGLARHSAVVEATGVPHRALTQVGALWGGGAEPGPGPR